MRIGIHGLGLEGAEIGMDVRVAFGDQVTVNGYDSVPSRSREARSAGAVDSLVSDLAELASADVVFVFDGDDGLADVFESLGRHLSAGTVVSYVGATQSNAASLATSLLPAGVSYVGSHRTRAAPPRGAARDSRRVWCLIPSLESSPNAISRLRDLVIALGYRPLLLTADEHDLYVAATDHLPRLVRAALLEVVVGSSGWRDLEVFAAELKGTEPGERLQSAELIANSEGIVHWLDRALAALAVIREAVDAGDQDGIEQLLARVDEYEARVMVPLPESERPAIERGVVGSLLGNRVARLFGRGR
jgi:prephenate dehydrogenase